MRGINSERNMFIVHDSQGVGHMQCTVYLMSDIHRECVG